LLHEADMQIRNNEARQQFEADVDGGMAVAAYELDRDIITFTHTAVPPAAEGKGFAGKLVEHALRDARERDLHVVAACPYVAAYIRKHPEHEALLMK
jgi:predicted GNAT family acetyltransferase